MTQAPAQPETLVDVVKSTAPRWRWALAEVGLLFLVLFLWGGGPPPETNEAHYLAKARHYWNPDWCRGDFFLESADAHLVFYWTLGWAAAILPLPAAAWVGRVLMWGLQAWSWQRLSWAVAPRPLLSVLTGALFLVLLDTCELAGEWVADGVEAKSFAFVLVFLALEAIVRNRWNAAWLLLGGASAFHVLVGGWTVIAAGVAWLLSFQDRPRLLSMLPALMGGLLLALPGLIPGVLLTRGLDPATVAQANETYVYYRLSHHLLPSAFAGAKYAAHLSLLAVFGVLCFTTLQCGAAEKGLRRIWGMAVGAVLIGLAGIGVFLITQHDPAVAARWLRFYFFRLSDAAVPLAASLTVATLFMRMEIRRPRVATTLLVVAVLIAAAGVGERFVRRQRDFRPGADRQSLPSYAGDSQATYAVYDAWRRMGEWVRENTPPDARFLTPRAQQTFKWYAHRPEVVSWKDVPQDAAALVEWRRRFDDIYGPIGWRGLTAYSDAQLLKLAQKYDVQYLVIDRTRATRRPKFERVYPQSSFENLYYEVYRIPAPSDAPSNAEAP